MSDLKLSSDEFMETFPASQSQSSMLISLAMLGGMVSFGVVVVIFYFTQKPANPANQQAIQTMNLFSLVNVCLMLSTLFASFFLPKLIVKNRGLQKAQNEEKEDIYSSAAQLFTSTHIIRLALLEGGGLFGLVVCFLGSQNGVLQTNPTFWFNGLPSAIFVFVILSILPTKSRVRGWFESQIHPLFEDSY